MMGKRTLAVVAALLTTVLACSTRRTVSSDADYLARRRHYSDSLTKRYKTEGDRIFHAESLALRDLEQRLRTVIGSVRIAGFSDTGRINLATLLPGDENSGLADGLLFRSADSSTQMFVTTRGVFSGWLADRFDDERGIPRDPAAALTHQNVYTPIFDIDAAVVNYADLPVVASGDRSVRAMLIDREQDSCLTCTPNRILLSAVAGNRVFIVDAPTRDTIPIPQPCSDAARADDRGQKAIDEYERTGRKDTSLLSRAFQAGEDRFTNQKTCYGTAVRSDPRFARIVAQARSLLELLPDR